MEKKNKIKIVAKNFKLINYEETEIKADYVKFYIDNYNYIKVSFGKKEGN